MSYTVHLGVKPPDLLRLMRLFPNNPLVRIDGDGWETWGEAANTDKNDEYTLHVLVGPFAEKNIAKVIGQYFLLDWADKLVPMTAEYQAGIRIVITQTEDWSEDVETML